MLATDLVDQPFYLIDGPPLLISVISGDSFTQMSSRVVSLVDYHPVADWRAAMRDWIDALTYLLGSVSHQALHHSKLPIPRNQQCAKQWTKVLLILH